MEPGETEIKRFTLVFVCLMVLLGACGIQRNFPEKFYAQNETKLEQIKDDFRKLYKEHSFSVLFEEKTFTGLSFEFNEDTIRYIYHFNINDPRFTDSLVAHRYNPVAIKQLLHKMQAIQCTWITNLDYYEDLQPRSLVQMTVRNKALNDKIKGESYCTLVFFEVAQPFNNKGVFLDRSDKKRRRQLNGHVLRKVNNYVGYTITPYFR